MSSARQISDPSRPAARVFLCYARKDLRLKNELLTHLAALEESGAITVVHDLMFLPGSDWEEEILEALHVCDLALLLVTPSFLASKFICETELPILTRRRMEGTVQLVPILLRPCAWEPLLGHLSALPASGRALSALRSRSRRDAAWREIVLAVQDLLHPSDTPSRQHRPRRLEASDGDGLDDPQEAARLLLELPAPAATQRLERLLESSGGGSWGRRQRLAALTERALANETYVPSLLARCFADLSAAHRDNLVRRLERSLEDGGARILGPVSLNPEVERFLSEALIACSRARASCILVSCIGMSDNLNLELHFQTLAVSSLKVYLNSPDLLIGLGEHDVQLASPDAVKDDYMLSRADGDTRVDVLRKLTRLFSSLHRLSDLRGRLEEGGAADGAVEVRFLRQRRPTFTCRILREVGYFVLFPDSIPLPRPLVRFGIVGNDVDIAESLALAAERLTPGTEAPWVPTNGALLELIDDAAAKVATVLRQRGYTVQELARLHPVLGLRSRGDGWIAHRILDRTLERM